MYSYNDSKFSVPHAKLGDRTSKKEIGNLGIPNEFVSF